MQIIRFRTRPLKASKTKLGFLFAAFISFILMLTIDYDEDFKLTAILPLAYFIFTLLIIDNEIFRYGMGGGALIIFYFFRMCILPVICALGNFYLEPSKGDYMDYYDMAMILTCFENLIVFMSLSYYCHYFRQRKIITKIVSKYANSSHPIILLVVVFFTLFIFIVTTIFGIDYFNFISKGVEGDFDTVSYQNLHAIWYILDLICTLWRPLASFLLVAWFIDKNKKSSYMLIFFVGILNVLFQSDRRIFSLLVGGFCFFYLTTQIKNRSIRNILNLILVFCIVLTISIGFLGSFDEGAWMVARTFQRYFSGPTLTAMALKANDVIGMQFLDFLKLLLNNFQLFTGTMGRFVMTDHYLSIFGMSRGLWTPMTAGSIRYFGIFFPVIIIIIVRYIVQCDYNVKKTDDELYKMIYSYIGVSVSCYMIMYSIELIVYFILSTALIYRILMFFESRKITCNSF